MSICSKFFACLAPPITWKMVIKLLSVEDAEGNSSINLCYQERGDCSNYESAFECLQNVTFEEYLKLIITEDACGNPAIQVLGNACDACNGEEEAPR